MVEQSDIAHYLLSLGVVKPRSVIEEELTVVDVSRRNRVFLVRTGSGPTFVVKQAAPENRPGLANEAAVLRLLAGAPALALHVPTVVHEEPGGACLVLTTPPGAREWTDRRGRIPPTSARVLGRVLAGLHEHRADMPQRAEAIPGVLFPEPDYELVVNLSEGAREVLAHIQTSTYLRSRLDELRAADAPDAVVHADLRWENCLSLPEPGTKRHTRLLIVDWELAGRGDPAFDVATVVASCLRSWFSSIPMVDAGAPARLEAAATRPLRSFLPAIGAFWSAYTRSSPRRPSLRRVVELAAVPLLEAAIERAQPRSAPSAQSMTLLNLAENLLRNPEAAATGLLELRP